MKSTIILLALVTLLACNHSSDNQNGGAAAKSVDSTLTSTAPKAVERSPLEPFTVVYHYKNGFFINGKPAGTPGAPVPETIADSMHAYIQRGGVIPDTFTCRFINDPVTGAPLMGVRSDVKMAVKEALALVKKSVPPAFSVMLDKKGVYINGALVNSASDNLTHVLIDSMKAFSKRGGKIPNSVGGIFIYHSKDAEGMYHNEVKSFIQDALDSLKIK